MPELPEVETLKRELGLCLLNQTIVGGKIFDPSNQILHGQKKLGSKLIGQKIIKVDRRAKVLFCHLSSGDLLLFHLKMTGQIIYQDTSGQLIAGGHPFTDQKKHLPNKHTRLYFKLDRGQLYFNDARRFAWIKQITATALPQFVANYGPEPLTPAFSQQYLYQLSRRFFKRKIKQLLLDQKLIAGIGNIYADESLFLAGIKPNRLAGDISQNELGCLTKAIKKILTKAISKKGTSWRDYLTSSGQPGNYVPYLKVYGRQGLACPQCGQTIIKIRQHGRGTHFCPQCQS